VALRGQVIAFIRLHFLHDMDHAGGIGHIPVVEGEPPPFLVRILVQMIDAAGVSNELRRLMPRTSYPLWRGSSAR
jgi:hypothetical protein